MHASVFKRFFRLAFFGAGIFCLLCIKSNIPVHTGASRYAHAAILLATEDVVSVQVSSNATLPPVEQEALVVSAVSLQNATAVSEPLPAPELQWQTVREGVEIGVAVLPESKMRANNAAFVVLRIDPVAYEFSLRMATKEGEALSLSDWSHRNTLLAGINASMYREDRLTSTGYMRDAEHVNNKSMGGRLGAFFVCDPTNTSLPSVGIIDRDGENWQETLQDYRVVAQNFRLLDKDGTMLWPEKDVLHSMAAVAMDNNGRVLFLLNQEPVTVARFVALLRDFMLDLSTVMYVEGGSDAGIFLRGDMLTPPLHEVSAFAGASAVSLPDGMVYVWRGRQGLLNIRGNPKSVLPNIIGVSVPQKK